MKLHLIRGIPRSAITEDELEAGRSTFEWFKSLIILFPATGLIALFLTFCVKSVLRFPHAGEWVGWLVFIPSSFGIVYLSWSVCDNIFQDYAREAFFSSFPVQRRDINGNIVPPPPPPTTVFVPGLKLKITPSHSFPKAPLVCTARPLTEVTPLIRPSS